MSREAARNEVSYDANWRNRCRLEALAAKQFDGDYGYLTGPISPLTPTGERPYAVGIAKYAGPSGMLIKTKRCPLVPKDKVMYSEPPMDESLSPTGITSLSSVALNHTRRMADIESRHMELESTMTKHFTGRRTLEMFGIAEFGVRETRTKLPSR